MSETPDWVTTPPSSPDLEGFRADPAIVVDAAEREKAVYERLCEVVDPELGINVVDLGLVYGVHVSEDFDVTIDMTLTTPACPLTDQIEWETHSMLSDLANSVAINWVWLPAWTMERISEAGREQLRYIGFNI